MNLGLLGWNQHFELLLNEFSNNTGNKLNSSDVQCTPARVVCSYGELYKLGDGETELLASVSGKFRYAASNPDDFPVTGDWVMMSAGGQDSRGKDCRGKDCRGIIHYLFPRASCISRKAAGIKVYEQPISANVDTAFIVTAFGYDFNERRVERYLTLAYESGVFPVIVINKSDTCDDPLPFVRRMEAIAFGVPVIAVSTKTKDGFESLVQFLTEGKTAVLIGSSGVGKSSIVNALAGAEVLDTGDLRKNEKGRHVTTQRELFVLGKYGIIIDNPGMRELQLWAEEGAEGSAFPEIDALTGSCKYTDCTHQHEPGCAVLAALESGAVEQERYNSYMKQKRELWRLSKYTGMSKKEMQMKRKDEHKKIALFARKLKK